MDSILTSIKKLLGIDEEITHFDPDVTMHINSALFALNQLGVGPTEGLFIIDKTATWVNLLGERKDLEIVKQYVYLKVRLIFDPPANSFLVEAINKSITECEWRINSQVETTAIVEETPTEEGGV